MKPYHTETLQHRGLTFLVEHHYDPDARLPWEDCDGHGVVIPRNKIPEGADRSNYRPLGDRDHYWVFNWTATIRKARREQWGIPKGQEGQGDPALLAAKADYERLRDWATEQWFYMGVRVSLPHTDLSSSLWGIESDSVEYLKEVARELADICIDDYADGPDGGIAEIDARIAELQRLRAGLVAAMEES